MPEWIVQPQGMIEPAPAPEFYIDGVGGIELIGACIRVYCIVEQLPLEAMGGHAQKIVVAKIVRPLRTVPSAIIRMAQCLGAESQTLPPKPSKPRLVE